MTSPPTYRRIGSTIASVMCIAGLVASPVIAIAEPIPDNLPTSQFQDQHRPEDRHRDGRGKIISVKPVRDLSAAEVRRTLQDNGYPTSEVRYGLTAYQVVYRTVDYHGRPTTASGLVSLPDTRRHRLQAVMFAHGTSPSKADAPSTGVGDYHQAGALSFAGAGFVSVAPDYLGLGVGPGRPVYLDTRTEVSASIDLLRAGRSLVAGLGRTLDHEVHLTGFSQGAHVALTTARALQDGQGGPGLRVGAVAPISGAYALRQHEIPAMLNGDIDPKMSTLYIGYLLTSWNAVHGLYRAPQEIFREPYASIVDDLYDGTTDSQHIYQAMPDKPSELLTEHGIGLLADPTGPLGEAVDDYDAACFGWQPEGGLRLYYAHGDDEVVNANTEACAAGFAQSGAEPPSADLGDLDHIESGAEGAVDAARWFRAVR